MAANISGLRRGGFLAALTAIIFFWSPLFPMFAHLAILYPRGTTALQSGQS
jgi:hypothetical protein